MTGFRRFSQAISEGDGISVIAAVGDAEGARAAEDEGAEGVTVVALSAGVREATSLPVFWRGTGSLDEACEWGVDACLVSMYAPDANEVSRVHARALDLGLDCVVEVGNEEDLEHALEQIDPEIFLISARELDDHDQDPLERVLDLLPDVPAGKLVIADVAVATREELLALERAGIDAVIVAAGDVAALVGDETPAV